MIPVLIEIIFKGQSRHSVVDNRCKYTYNSLINALIEPSERTHPEREGTVEALDAILHAPLLSGPRESGRDIPVTE